MVRLCFFFSLKFGQQKRTVCCESTNRQCRSVGLYRTLCLDAEESSNSTESSRNSLLACRDYLRQRVRPGSALVLARVWPPGPSTCSLLYTQHWQKPDELFNTYLNHDARVYNATVMVLHYPVISDDEFAEACLQLAVLCTSRLENSNWLDAKWTGVELQIRQKRDSMLPSKSCADEESETCDLAEEDDMVRPYV